MIFTAPEIQKRTKSHDQTQALSLKGTNSHKWNNGSAVKAMSRAKRASEHYTMCWKRRLGACKVNKLRWKESKTKVWLLSTKLAVILWSLLLLFRKTVHVSSGDVSPSGSYSGNFSVAPYWSNSSIRKVRAFCNPYLICSCPLQIS